MNEIRNNVTRLLLLAVVISLVFGSATRLFDPLAFHTSSAQSNSTENPQATPEQNSNSTGNTTAAAPEQSYRSGNTAAATTCIPSTIGGQTATLTDDTCEASISCGLVDSPGNCRELVPIFRDQCAFLAGGNLTKVPDYVTIYECRFPAS